MIFNERAHRKVVRTLIAYGLLFLIGAASLVLGIASSAMLLLVIGALFALLTGYQTVQALRDLGASPTTTSGPVSRKWSRNDFVMFGRTYYARLDKRIFVVDKGVFDKIQRGDMLSIVHYPHTGALEKIELVPPPSEEGSADAPDWRWPAGPKEGQQ